MVIHRSNPQKDHPCAETRRLSHKASKSVQRFELGVGSRKKGKDRIGQDRTVKKSHKVVGNISPIWGEAPTVPIETKICMAGNLADVITCAKFQDEIFRGYDFTGGRFPIFLSIFACALQQCSATSLPVMRILVKVVSKHRTDKYRYNAVREHGVTVSWINQYDVITAPVPRAVLYNMTL